ncbi:hypothetical protein CK500_01440 [Halorubrum salipaludis]|uniref:Lipoprotein n=1 Tax=Halorubrum salipaludis TaxID=2032630 RepID=A0A2A2FIP9_9EURY|nr:hypothetical protein [Halorubrum salipaludis]PAU85361.1 hypothetical protein CK500_01440 [Halorubrum salipaludis]
MNRRTLLGGVGVAFASSLGGCLDGSVGDGDGSGGGTGGDGDRPTELRDATFTTGIEGAPAADEPPRIAFDEAASRVTVEGTISYSSSSCGEVALDRATYDAAESAASVRVVGRRDAEAGEECTDDIAADSYRVELTFDGGVPETVEAVEDGEFDEFVVTAP